MSSQQIKSNMFNKTMGQQSGSAKTHLDSVADLTKTAKLAHQSFHEDLQRLLKEVNLLRQEVKNNPTELKKFFKAKFKPVQDALVYGQETQKQQNKVVQQQMTEIKRQNRQTAEAIIKTFEKLKYMQTRIGHYM